MAEKAKKPLGSPIRDLCQDELLNKSFKQAEDSAFEKILDDNVAEVAALANRLLGWPGDVDDVVQDVFLKAYLGLKKFRGDCSLRTWLFSITINECRKCRYRQMLRTKHFLKAGNRSSPAWTGGADDIPVRRDTFERVRKAVMALPARYREPVVLRYLHELPAEKISTILGISRNALDVRLSRARKRLKERLGDLMEE